MTPNIKNITLAAATLLLAACSDTPDARYSVGSEDNEVRISAGIASSPRGIESRDAQAGHYAFTAGTNIYLHVEGYWARKSPERIEKIEKTAIFSASDAADTINAISYLKGEQIYWDDFGTADPDNTENRSKGLGVLAVAIDRVTTETTIADKAWLSSDAATDLPWSVVTDGTNSFKNDILVANNLYDASSTKPQKRYTFDEQKAATPGESRLDFKHVLSKITFVLTAGSGFPIIHGNPGFISDPKVVLTRNKTGEKKTEWCYTSGTINIKTATATANPDSLKKVTLDDIDRSGAKFTHEAIIYPGSQFGGENDIVAQINADGNIYYVTAKQIRAAIVKADAPHAGIYNTLPGYNYIFQVTVNKTDIKVTATISDWKTVTATEETPKIVVSANVGKQDDNTKTLNKFRFYRNADGASKTGKYIALADAKNPQAIADGSTIWNFYNVDGSTPTPLYWPNHTTHYFFRGVYPYNTAVTDGGGTSTYIQAVNGEFGTSTYYNLMIGAPEIASDTKCDNPDHTPVDMSTEGICARTGKINLNFRYMMAQVEVKLTTTTGDDKVILNNNTTVELVNTITSRRIYLGTRSIGSIGDESPTRKTYSMTQTADVKVFHDAIVPQSLPDEVQLKITVKDGTESDVYYAVVNKIKVGGSNITNWEAGKHYVYTLNIKKTGIS
ncbi:MAG: fimbrillin family protein, partial [Muribaculaceae bacterium]|nr:fimbrillin family protein [Muribaculaceae bacterium]